MPEASPNGPAPRPRTPWWFRLIRALLNLALLVVLGSQIFLLILLSENRHLQLPQFAQRAIEARLQEQGLQVRFSSLEVSPTGTLLVRDPKIYLVGSPDPAVEAEYLLVEPDWLTVLLSHRLSFSRMRFGNATFFCPPENSPNGERVPFLSEFSAGLVSQGAPWWQVDFVRGKFLNLRFAAQGNVIMPPTLVSTLTPTPATGPVQPAPLAVQYRRWARQLLELQPQFAMAERPSISLALSGQEPGVNDIQVYAWAAAVHPPASGLEVRGAKASLSASWDGKALHATSPLRAFATAVNYTGTGASATSPFTVSAGPLSARAQLSDGPKGVLTKLPLRISLDAFGAKLDGFSLDSVDARADLRAWPNLLFSADTAQGADTVTISGQAPLAETDDGVKWNGGEITLHALMRLETALDAAKVALPARLASLKFDAPLKLDGTVSITPTGRIQSTDLAIRTDGVHFDKIDLTSLQAKTRLAFDEKGALQEVEVEKAVLANRTWQVQGSYWQNLRNNNFRLVAQGNLDPQVLTPYLDAWWGTVWEIVSPGETWPNADIAYWGNWSGRGTYDNVDVFAQASHARAHGVPMDDIRVQVQQLPPMRDGAPQVLSVYNITGHASGGGDLSGGLYWVMRPPFDHIFIERMVFDSTLPLKELGLVGGPIATQVVQPLESDAAPTVHFEQRTGGQGSPQPEVTATTVHAEIAAPIHAYHVPLDNAAVDVTAYDGFTEIPHFKFGLAGGNAEGNATLTSPKGNPAELRFSVLLQNARHTDFLADLGQFRASDEPPPASPPSDAPLPAGDNGKKPASILGDTSKPGILDLALGARFLIDQPDSFAGAGAARVRGAQLGQVQLLGDLSKLLADTHLPLGTFTLTDAASKVQIAHAYLRLPNLVVTGPSARIVAAGTYDLNTQDLNFNALIFPIAQWDSSVLKQLASIMNPFSNTVTLKLQGKFNEPKWSISMNPLRLFKDRTVEGPAIPDYPALEDGNPKLPELPPAPDLPALATEKK